MRGLFVVSSAGASLCACMKQTKWRQYPLVFTCFAVLPNLFPFHLHHSRSYGNEQVTRSSKGHCFFQLQILQKEYFTRLPVRHPGMWARMGPPFSCSGAWKPLLHLSKQLWFACFENRAPTFTTTEGGRQLLGFITAVCLRGTTRLWREREIILQCVTWLADVTRQTAKRNSFSIDVLLQSQQSV